MAIKTTCTCGRILKAKDEHAGLRAICPSCGSIVNIRGDGDRSGAVINETEAFEDRLSKLLPEDDEFIPNLETSPTHRPAAEETVELLQEILFQLKNPKPMPLAAKSARLEYKVLTQKDKWFSGKFDPERLESALNAYVSQGWRVVSAVAASFPGFGGSRDEIVVILERSNA